jgi:hypothetical protein
VTPNGNHAEACVVGRSRLLLRLRLRAALLSRDERSHIATVLAAAKDRAANGALVSVCRARRQEPGPQ